MVNITSICMFLIVLLKPQSCEVYTSLSSMEKLLKTQAHLIETIGYHQNLFFKKERRILKTFLGKMKTEQVLSQSDPEHYLGNPINAFTLIMRLYRDLEYVERFLNNTDSYRRNESLVYPEIDDAKGAIDGIIRIHLMYDLDIAQLANGTLISHFNKNKQRYVEHVTPMTANDCIDLGLINYDKEDKSRNIIWLTEAYRKYNTDRILCSFTEGDLTKQIALQYYSIKDLNNTIFWLEKCLASRPDDFGTLNMLELVKKRYEEQQRKPEVRRVTKKKKSSTVTLMQLCRDELRVTSTSSLFCYFAHGPHPFLILAPIKAERLHLKPDVTMFYDVITDAEAEVLKTRARPTLKRALVMGEENNRFVTSEIRISRSTTPAGKPDEVIRVLRRVHQFTGLRWTLETEEAYQIANYGIAGHYETHSDVFKEAAVDIRKSKGFGYRVATTLFYLSDVEQGGATVFLKMNLTVFPVKNAAIYWWNLNPWGHEDKKVIHAACPVLRGSKWLLTKWINLAGQELIRPCPAEPPQEEFVNS